jgi:hypothetical protein
MSLTNLQNIWAENIALLVLCSFKHNLPQITLYELDIGIIEATLFAMK